MTQDEQHCAVAMNETEAVHECCPVTGWLDPCEMASIRSTLKRYGMHVVSDADMRVLEAMQEIPDGTIHSWPECYGSPSVHDALNAEIARREGKL